MCGLFGAVLPTLYPSAEISVSWCLRFLGVRAEERGQDAAGIAVCRPDAGWTVAKTLGPFHALYGNRRRRERLFLGQPVSALGHTRWATQGGRSIAQASPLTAGPLLCTHNGDLDATTIPWTASGVNDESGTDSHRLFRAIAAAHTRGRGLTARLVKILSGVRGRAALVWTDTSRADRRVWLARGGLSPLAVGIDQHGGLWWASNPAWLREMGVHAGLQITVTLLPEGTLWVAVPYQRHVRCTLIAEFKPTVRRRDESIAAVAVWRGFTREDTTYDQTLLRHRTVA